MGRMQTPKSFSSALHMVRQLSEAATRGDHRRTRHYVPFGENETAYRECGKSGSGLTGMVDLAHNWGPANAPRIDREAQDGRRTIAAFNVQC